MKIIGIIGKSVLTSEEEGNLRWIAQCIHRMGHRVALVPAKGTATVMREGVESEGGEVLALAHGVIERSDQTLVYPDKRLLDRLSTTYPTLDERKDIVVIREDQLTEWVEAVTQIMEERGIALPPR